jgi:hypothetical protein
MTKDRLLKIFEDQTEIDPWMETNFFQPLLSLVQTSEDRYPPPSTPPRLWEARDFAVALWECNDDQEMQLLAEAEPEGAAQLAALLVLRVLERQLERPAEREGIEPRGHKPFAALASRALEWLDEIEATAPSKTQRPE